MGTSEIIGVVALSVMFVALAILEFITIMQNRKLQDRLDEYKRFSNYISAKQRIIYEKKVDYKSLYDSCDYLTYNSKIIGESRKLTEEEFHTLKRDYLFYVWPKTKFIPECEVNKNENL